MFNKVVVGVDGRQGGRDAVVLADKLLAAGGSLTFAHVFPDPAASAVRGYDESESAETVRSRELLRTVSEEARIPAHLRWIGADSPGRGLHVLAESLRADLLVVGSTRRGYLGRVLIGDDTREALNGAPCAVAIAPAGYAEQPGPIRAIGVGYDGSPDSQRAVTMARALAAEHGASVAALEVAWRPASQFTGRVAGDSARVADLVKQARNHASALGDIEGCGAYGQPAEELAQWSSSLDLLVVGSRGWGPVGRLIHGSTSQELARRARCPLLVLTRAAGVVSESGNGTGHLELAAAVRDSAPGR